MRMLENEGFAFENYVDIFDGGPTMTAKTDQVRSIRDSRPAVVEAIASVNGDPALIATGEMIDFRCCFGTLAGDGDAATIDADTAATLDITAGAAIRWVAR